MKITWYGTATIGIDDGKTRLLFDPFVRMNKKIETTPIEGFVGFDAVFGECVESDRFVCSYINDCSAVIGESVFFCIAGQVVGLTVFDSENFSVTDKLVINALVVSTRKVTFGVAERNLNLNYIIRSDCVENDFFSLFG